MKLSWNPLTYLKTFWSSKRATQTSQITKAPVNRRKQLMSVAQAATIKSAEYATGAPIGTVIKTARTGFDAFHKAREGRPMSAPGGLGVVAKTVYTAVGESLNDRAKDYVSAAASCVPYAGPFLAPAAAYVTDKIGSRFIKKTPLALSA